MRYLLVVSLPGRPIVLIMVKPGMRELFFRNSRLVKYYCCVAILH